MPSYAEPITIAVDDGIQRFRPAASAAAGARLLCARAWRRRRNDPSVHGGGRGRARGARHRDVALPVPLHGARQQAAGSAEACARRGPRRRGRSRPAVAEAAAHRRRQIVRRTDDLAGAGRGAAAGRARIGVPRLSAASGEAAVAGARQASVRRASADAVPARNARRARRRSISSNRCARSSAHARRCSCSRAPITRSMCRREAAAPTPQVMAEMLDTFGGLGARRWSAADPEVWLIAVPVGLAARWRRKQSKNF